MFFGRIKKISILGSEKIMMRYYISVLFNLFLTTVGVHGRLKSSVNNT